ncbi:MAG: methyltransferase family protein [Gemmatimonadota bacterium]
MAVNLRVLRLRGVWLLILPFFWYARPTPWSILLGALPALAGLLLRAWAAGTIRKERELTTQGPYAFTRSPLYLGSFLLGTGVAVAGGVPLFVVLFFLFFAGVYGWTIRAETRELEELFGDAFRAYRTRVPAFLPRLTPYAAGREGSGGGSSAEPRGFTWKGYLRYREWEAALGTLAGFAVLVLKWWLT